MEAIYAKGVSRSIGLDHFSDQGLAALADIKPEDPNNRFVWSESDLKLMGKA